MQRNLFSPLGGPPFPLGTPSFRATLIEASLLAAQGKEKGVSITYEGTGAQEEDVCSHGDPILD